VRHVGAHGAGKAAQYSTSESSFAIHRHHPEVAKDAPQLTPLLEARLDWGDLLIAVEQDVGHRIEVVDERQVELGMTKVGRDVDNDGTCVRADEVVLLGVAVEQ
jgi:hypothetical protein